MARALVFQWLLSSDSFLLPVSCFLSPVSCFLLTAR